MGGIVCSIINNGQVTTINRYCLRNPNRRECYGKFDDRFVNFPDHAFPTHEARGEIITQLFRYK